MVMGAGVQTHGQVIVHFPAGRPFPLGPERLRPHGHAMLTTGKDTWYHRLSGRLGAFISRNLRMNVDSPYIHIQDELA